MNDQTAPVAIIGLSHDHVWDHLPQLSASGRGRIVGVADPHDELRERAQSEFGLATYDSYHKLVAELKPAAVYVFSSNAEGAEIATWAANQGLHVMVEKPMAATLAQADELLAAARANGVRLMINWPFAWWPQLQHALRLASAGEIGSIWQVKYRAAHAGPEEEGCTPFFCNWLFDPERNGGGALMDYCCYGAVLASALLGLPHQVTAVAGRLCKETILVEDNAILVMSYPRALATAEGSWTQLGQLSSYSTVIYGSRGTLLVEPRAGGRLLKATAEDPQGSPVDVPPPAPDLVNATEHFLEAVRSQDELFVLCQARICRDAQEILEAGRMSADLGKSISLPLRTLYRNLPLR